MQVFAMPRNDTTTQADLIDFHKQMSRDRELCEWAELRAHYEHILLGLRKLIESHGPTSEYLEWTTSAHSS